MKNEVYEYPSIILRERISELRRLLAKNPAEDTKRSLLEWLNLNLNLLEYVTGKKVER